MSAIMKTLGLGGSASKGSSVPLPLYSPVAPSEATDAESSRSIDGDLSEIENDQLHPAQRHGKASRSSTPLFRLPSLTRFLADFTLGFADGLTVPFALTAGLSSLGETETVIYAGMAEICAGSISMGIGGYLSAKGENAAARREAEDKQREGLELEDAEKAAMLSSSSSSSRASDNSVVEDYLAPLELPEKLRTLLSSHLDSRPEIARALVLRAQKQAEDDDDDSSVERLSSPIVVGFSVSLGYLLGGLLPLFPYFFVSQVGDGLLWSFVVCVVALFVFGFSKDFMLHREACRRDEKTWSKNGRSVPWKAIRQSVWEGIQMVILGSVAAAAAVLCVRAFEGMKSDAVKQRRGL